MMQLNSTNRSLAVFTALVTWVGASASERAAIVVGTHGRGDFQSVQEAVNSVQQNDTTPVMILIRNGVYNEKVFVRRSHLTLVGEDRDSTRIIYPELRENWNRDHGGNDWGSGVVNIDTGTTDITLANLTVYNNYGVLNGVWNKHQFAVRGAGTRIILLHCAIISDGGDALSLWNRADGMYYHADCYFEGWVDFVCPRGWCYVTNSQFFGHNKPSASIWHDGSFDRRQKFVVANSTFDGVPGFPLGRNHWDGQFFLVHCRFSAHMADRPIYRPPSSVKEWQWGARHFFFDCHRDGGDFAWFKDNLEAAEGAPRPEEITAGWAFDGQWDPEGTMLPVLPFAILPSPGMKARDVQSTGIAFTWVAGRNARSHNMYWGQTSPPTFAASLTAATFEPGRLERNTTYFWRVDEVTDEGIIAGQEWQFSTR